MVCHDWWKLIDEEKVMVSEFYLMIFTVWGSIFYIGYGVTVWLCWNLTGAPTRYQILEFILFLPVTGLCWLLSKAHNFMKEKL